VSAEVEPKAQVCRVFFEAFPKQDYEADQADFVYHYDYADKVEEQNKVDQKANVNQV